MQQKFLLPKARNMITGQTIKTQDLTGGRFTFAQRALAEEMAQRLAKDLSNRTRQSWIALVEEYTPTQRR